MDLVQDPLTLEAAASAVQTSHDDAVWADEHGVPAEGETVTHSLTTGGAVTEYRTNKEKTKNPNKQTSNCSMSKGIWLVF